MNAQALKFLEVYVVELRKDIEKAPAEYGLSQAPFDVRDIRANSTALKMVQSMEAGNLVNVSNAMRRTARRLGVPQTVKAIHTYCKGA